MVETRNQAKLRELIQDFQNRHSLTGPVMIELLKHEAQRRRQLADDLTESDWDDIWKEAGA